VCEICLQCFRGGSYALEGTTWSRFVPREGLLHLSPLESRFLSRVKEESSLHGEKAAASSSENGGEMGWIGNCRVVPLSTL